MYLYTCTSSALRVYGETRCVSRSASSKQFRMKIKLSLLVNFNFIETQQRSCLACVGCRLNRKPLFSIKTNVYRSKTVDEKNHR